MKQTDIRIGERLKEIRGQRKMTLDDMAKATGVSKPMLGQIERGQSSPTINILWKIATGLKVPLSSFCRQQEAEYTVAVPDEKEMIAEEEGRMRAYSLFPYDPIRSVEIFYIEFDEGVRHCSECHADGVEEYIFVIQGAMELVIGSKQVILTEKQSVRFNADVPHAYNNISEACCQIYNMIFYPND